MEAITATAASPGSAQQDKRIITRMAMPPPSAATNFSVRLTSTSSMPSHLRKVGMGMQDLPPTAAPNSVRNPGAVDLREVFTYLARALHKGMAVGMLHFQLRGQIGG